MKDWTHELSREQYEMLIDSILRASTIATAIEDMADNLDPVTLKETVRAMRARILECLVLGGFDEADIDAINKDVLASMYTRPDA